MNRFNQTMNRLNRFRLAIVLFITAVLVPTLADVLRVTKEGFFNLWIWREAKRIRNLMSSELDLIDVPYMGQPYPNSTDNLKRLRINRKVARAVDDMRVYAKDHHHGGTGNEFYVQVSSGGRHLFSTGCFGPNEIDSVVEEITAFFQDFGAGRTPTVIIRMPKAEAKRKVA